MVLLVNLLIVMTAGFLILWPFLKKEVDIDYFLESNSDEFKKRELLFSTLGEIEFDYKMNKLSEEDYKQLKLIHQEQAVKILDQEDKEVEYELQKELSRLKSSK
ncbi:MAG: hypothetical protein ACOYVD_08175 [Bacillota bacterium]